MCDAFLQDESGVSIKAVYHRRPGERRFTHFKPQLLDLSQ